MAELYPVLRNMTTNDLAKKMLSYKYKPVESWRADGCGPLDALNKMFTLRASSREHALRNDLPHLSRQTLINRSSKVRTTCSEDQPYH